MVLGTMVDLSVLSYLLLIIRKEQGAVIGRGRASPQPSVGTEPVFKRWARRSPPLDTGQGGTSPRGSGEAEPIFRHSGKKHSRVLV